MRTWACSLGLSMIAACAVAPPDPHAIPVAELSEKQRERVDRVLSDLAATVPLEPEEVRSRLEVYDFLLGEMPFTGGIVRELNRGKWDIYRHPTDPKDDVFYVKDPDGMWLRFELIHRDAARWIYLSKGFFEMGILPRLEGTTVVVLRAVPRDGVIMTDAVVYVKVDSGFYDKAAKAFRGILEKTVRDKSGYFIKAAKWVAEEAAQRPEWLYRQVKGSKEVDQDVLEEFRKKYLVLTNQRR